jgi:hypothetical protein
MTLWRGVFTKLEYLILNHRRRHINARYLKSQAGAELRTGVVSARGRARIQQPEILRRVSAFGVLPARQCCHLRRQRLSATRSVSAARPGSSDGWQLMVKHGKDAPTATPRSDAVATSNERKNGHFPNPRFR